MSIRVVTVFGGTGFLGRRVVRHLRKHEFSVRIASRHLDRSRKLFGSDEGSDFFRASSSWSTILVAKARMRAQSIAIQKSFVDIDVPIVALMRYEVGTA